MNRNDSIRKLNTINVPSKSKQKNHSILDYNGNSCHVGSNNNESIMKNEISSLRKEIAKLKTENKKIKELYEKEIDRNKMYKDFSEELIKNYE